MNGNNVCEAEGNIGTRNGTHFFFSVADYLRERFALEQNPISSTEEERSSESGFRDGLECRPRNFWRIRKAYLNASKREGTPLEVVEGRIKRHQEIYRIAYHFGRSEAIKNYPFLEDLPVRTIGVA